MIERIDRLSAPPVVGRFYMVPTVRYPLWGIVRDWPVSGPLHDDAEHLNFPSQHYHFDHRFVPPRDFERVFEQDWRGVEVTVHAIVLAEYEHSKPDGFEQIPSQPVWRRKKCWREAIRYPHDRASAHESRPFGKLWRAWEGAQAARSASGWVCPHRNYPLGNARQEDGALICPLHGLRICATSGVVLPHASAQAKGESVMSESIEQIAARLTSSQRALLTEHDDFTKSGEGFDELLSLGLVERREDQDDVVFYDLTASGRFVASLLAKERG